MIAAAFSNGLSEAQEERLTQLIEESGEIIQAVCKIKRHGLESRNPTVFKGCTNRTQLAKEVGDLMAVVDLLYATGDLSEEEVQAHAAVKRESMKQWQHFQGDGAQQTLLLND